MTTQGQTATAFAGLVAAVALAATACGGETDGAKRQASGTVTVFAAASLTEPFTRIAENFEDSHPGATVTLSFAGSSTLARQINEGAPVDVFAPADEVSMRLVADAGVNGVEPTTFARNELVIAVPAGNPLGITGLAGLGGPGVKVALCVEQVPCGRAAARALKAGGVELVAATLERDVKAAMAKVELGEVDAALVYRSDVRSASRVDGVEFPEAAIAKNDYQISVLDNAPNETMATAFVAYVRSDVGMAMLIEAGFEVP